MKEDNTSFQRSDVQKIFRKMALEEKFRGKTAKQENNSLKGKPK